MVDNDELDFFKLPT